MLVEDIQASGRDAVLGFWESLFALHPHPNLLGALDELSHAGHGLEQNIILDKCGPDLKACRLQHREDLLEKTQNLVEHRAPGLTNESQSFSITERYLDLIVVSSQHFRSRPQHELIATGGIHEHYLQRAQSNLERISPNRLFHWCHRKRCVPQAVLVSGVPGVGKTTLMQKFVYDWANGNLYQRFAFVFSFKFRNLNNKEELSLAQMIINEYPYLHSQLDTIFRNPVNCFLFLMV
ncbi:NACHT, LRR and PYD domains-containing protein 14-like [Xenopus tropicalis]|uniref:NACHT, LRR and PYD domains-containing protein 14-like n=1 Tax=Xenopus tropicalis TaxID=8364 RepID=A0A8J1IQG1_XENTR|nr:NACHT, LRR and PYD domains-containing protein 14-like [Xenopus tropicalis]